jgi:hypothetical protein
MATLNNSPIISKKLFQFEVKIWKKGTPKCFENISPRLVICNKDKPEQAYDDYMNFLNEQEVDTSNIEEFRVNRVGSSQGHYFRPNGW